MSSQEAFNPLDQAPNRSTETYEKDPGIEKLTEGEQRLEEEYGGDDRTLTAFPLFRVSTDELIRHRKEGNQS